MFFEGPGPVQTQIEIQSESPLADSRQRQEIKGVS